MAEVTPDEQERPPGVLAAPTELMAIHPDIVQVTLFLHVGHAINNVAAINRMVDNLNNHATHAVATMLAH